MAESLSVQKPAKSKQFGAAALALASVVILGLVIAKYTIFAEMTPGEASRTCVAIDAQTGELFEHFRLKEGMTLPFPNPKTGTATVYPAEACYWTSDGQAKFTPTFLLMNEFTGKSGPTKCPDCGRVVVPHNPTPPLNLMVEAAKRAGKWNEGK